MKLELFSQIMLEREILGTILCRPNLIDRALETIGQKDFEQDENAAVFEAFVSLNRCLRVVDFEGVVETLQRSGKLQEIGGSGFVAGLTGDLPKFRSERFEWLLNTARKLSQSSHPAA